VHLEILEAVLRDVLFFFNCAGAVDKAFRIDILLDAVSAAVLAWRSLGAAGMTS
jgi:hypothetical protein